MTRLLIQKTIQIGLFVSVKTKISPHAQDEYGSFFPLPCQMGRNYDGLNSSDLGAVLMAIANPNYLRDAGFQLSFMATLGLVLYAEPLTEAFLRLGAPGSAAQRGNRTSGQVSPRRC
jgi:hypothetical protein